MRIAVFEDNAEHTDRITAAIESWAKSTNANVSIAAFRSVFDAADICVFDCIMLDVEMPGMNGIEFAHELRQNGINIPIVFISSYTEYSLDGYEVDALRFLDKNNLHFDRKFNECMDRLAFEINNSLNVYYRITAERKLISIPMHEITFFEVVNHDLVTHTLTGAFTERKTLSQLRTELPKQFVQIGKSLIVNVLQLVQVTKGQVLFRDGTKLPVAPRYSDNLFRAYSEML